MRMKTATALIAGCAALGLASAAHAQPSSADQQAGWYIGGEAGWSHLEDMDATGSAAGLTASGTVKPSDGFAVGGNVGYAFPGGIRLEGEVAYRDHDLNSVSSGGGSFPVSGDIDSIAFMANALYDFIQDEPLTPYIGAGIGGARLGINNLRAPTVASGSFSDSNFVLAYQAIGGVKYAFDTNWSANLDYRYLATEDATFSGGGGSLKTSYHTHNVMLGIAYHFASPPPPPPEAPPPAPVAAAPPPPPPPATREFLVFFDFDKATLTPEGIQVIQQAAATFKTTGEVKLDATGYTDLSGTAQYNMGLSKNRADAVTDALVNAGVPKSAIVEAWHGKENPRVATPDGVREPQNRRVEIVLP